MWTGSQCGWSLPPTYHLLLPEPLAHVPKETREHRDLLVVTEPALSASSLCNLVHGTDRCSLPGLLHRNTRGEKPIPRAKLLNMSLLLLFCVWSEVVLTQRSWSGPEDASATTMIGSVVYVSETPWNYEWKRSVINLYKHESFSEVWLPSAGCGTLPRSIVQASQCWIVSVWMPESPHKSVDSLVTHQ